MTGEMKRTPIPKDAVIYWRLPFDAIPDHELGHQAARFRDGRLVVPDEVEIMWADRYGGDIAAFKVTPLSWWQRVWSRLTSPRHRLPYR